MKLTVSFQIDHKDLGKLQEVIATTRGFAVTMTSETATDATTTVVPIEETSDKTPEQKTADLVKKAEKKSKSKKKPVVEAPPVEEVSADEVRAAMLECSKKHKKERAIEILKDVGKASKCKDVDPSDYPALIEAFRA